MSDPASLLVQEVVGRYSGKVTFVSENFGASKLAERFGVTSYPAVFVDDVLVATPEDFGYFGTGGRRYSPWRNAESQAKFKADLTRMIDLVLAGKKQDVRRERADPAAGTGRAAELPRFNLTDLSGRPLSNEATAGRVVLVEFWATWCLPCRSTLEWLAELKRKHGDRIDVLALAVESPEDQVRATAGSVSAGLRWAMADAPTARAFGDVAAIPTLLLFDRSGKSARVLYGAPPGMHEDVEKTIAALLGEGRP